MTRQRVLLLSGAAATVLVLAGLLLWALPRWYGATTDTSTATAPPASDTAGRRIKARLFYLSEDGTQLMAVEREVPFGDDAVEQARTIITAQVAPVAEPLVSAVPPGTILRGVFITSRGEAYVDLSSHVSTAHTGGTLDELLTVYTFVNALTANLPVITAVQLLVEGKEVPTLAGHVNLLRPLSKNLTWIQ